MPRIKSGARDPRAAATVKNMVEGQKLEEAGINAGYSRSYMRSPIYRSGTYKWIQEEVAKRHKRAISRAGVHTDAIVGNLVEIMDGSIADVLPSHPILVRARKAGVDHLIKKISITPVKMGERKRLMNDGKFEFIPVIREKIDLEMYSKLDAISQLRDNFGMKQEARANTFESTRRQEIEKSLQVIMDREGCDQSTAAQKLLEVVDAPQLIPFIEKYVN